MALSELGPARYKGQAEDLSWGKYQYKVTRTQKDALDAFLYVLYGWSPDLIQIGIPSGLTYSQRHDGAVTLTLSYRSMTVYRSGRIKPNW